MPISIAFSTPRSLANAAHKEIAAATDVKTIALPWNRFALDNTMWWISPATDNPAFKYGKYVFDPELSLAGGIFVGMHIEKGFGSVVSHVPGTNPQRHVIRNDWTWNVFAKDAISGEVDNVLTGLTQELREPVFVRVDAPPLGHGEFDPYAKGCDAVRFKIEASGVSFDAENSTFPNGKLSEAAKCTSISAMAKLIDSHSEKDWFWINWYMGLDCSLDPGKKDPSSWSAAELSRNLLLPLRRWFQ
jgi:hypothetical protein